MSSLLLNITRKIFEMHPAPEPGLRQLASCLFSIWTGGVLQPG